MRRVVFHLEAGGSAGWGHLVRCAALAAELKRRQCSCVLWTSSELRDVPSELLRPFKEVLAMSPQNFLRPPAVVRAADWIIIDNYEVTDETLRALRTELAGSRRGPSPKLLVLDDGMQRRLDAADLVLNAQLGLASAAYAPRWRALLGQQYALMRSGLREPSAVVSPFSAGKIPVLIMLGGTDPRNVAGEVAHALADVDPQTFVPVVVRGQSAAGGRSLMDAFDRFAESAWLGTLDAAMLAGWAGFCRYAISAAGGTLYELALLDLPFVGLIAADNQRVLAREASRCWQMPAVEITADLRTRVADAFRELIERFPADRTGGRTRFSDIDGLGPARVANVLLAPVGLGLR